MKIIMKNNKKLLSVLLSISMILSLTSIKISANDEIEIDNGDIYQEEIINESENISLKTEEINVANESSENVQVIYLDLSAGNVIINESEYSGYIFNKSGEMVNVKGSHLTSNQYYVYQTNPTLDNQETDANGVPDYDRMTYNNKTWGNYITNNTNIADIVSNWNNSANDVNRAATANRIEITGNSYYDVIVDSIWSSYISSSSSRTTGGISFNPDEGGNAVIRIKGDNRVGNVFYTSKTFTNTSITFENINKDGQISTLTCASFDGKSNHYNSVIGGNDNNGGDHSIGIIINGGLIYAGAQKNDNCSAIGGGGNGIGDVVINDGIITAVANSSGAAIGGGIGESSNGGVGYITINGGEIYAYNFGYVSSSLFIPAAAIGGGSSRDSIGNVGNVTINGGYVYAQSLGGAGIGGGSSTKKSGGDAVVTISGTAIVEAKSVSGIDTSGNEVHAGGSIGGGTAGSLGTANGGNASLTINGGNVTTGSIGGGHCDNNTGKIGSADVVINDGVISGQIIMAAGASTDCSFLMTGGVIDNSLFDKNIDTPFVFLKNYGGAVHVENGTAILEGGYIQNCSSDMGGAIYVNGGNFEMKGGIIQNCASEYGGAICVNNGNFTMFNGIIQECNSLNGGAAYVKNGNIQMYNGTIQKCISETNGGALYIHGGNFDMHNGVIDSNETTSKGGALYVESDSSDIMINIYDGEIINNHAGAHAGAIGANAKGNYAININIGLIECLGLEHSKHEDGDCPIIRDNIADIQGGAICLHSESDSLNVKILCGNINGNIAVRYEGTNTINQEGGILQIYGGNIDGGISIGGGVYDDNRPGTDERQIKIRLWSNYDGGSTTPVIVECTMGVTLNLPTNIYVRAGSELSGWSTSADGTTGWKPVGGRFMVSESTDGYMDLYAVWDAKVSFVVYIPDTTEIDSNGYGNIEIEADLTHFKVNSLLSVIINTDFKLYNTQNTENYVEYTVTTNEPGIYNSIKNGDTIASFQWNNTRSKTITIDINEGIAYSAIYQGNISYIIKYEETIEEIKYDN